MDGENLYVADTENHAIRLVNLQTKEVKTITGNGKQAEWRSVGGNAQTCGTQFAVGFGQGWQCALYCDGWHASDLEAGF